MRALFLLLLLLLGAPHCATKAGVASILCLEVFHNTREQCEMLLTQVSNSFPKSYITRHALAPFLPV